MSPGDIIGGMFPAIEKCLPPCPTCGEGGSFDLEVFWDVDMRNILHLRCKRRCRVYSLNMPPRKKRGEVYDRHEAIKKGMEALVEAWRDAASAALQ